MEDSSKGIDLHGQWTGGVRLLILLVFSVHIGQFATRQEPQSHVRYVLTSLGYVLAQPRDAMHPTIASIHLFHVIVLQVASIRRLFVTQGICVGSLRTLCRFIPVQGWFAHRVAVPPYTSADIAPPDLVTQLKLAARRTLNFDGDCRGVTFSCQ